MTPKEFIALALSAETDEARAALIAMPDAPLSPDTVSEMAAQVERSMREDPRQADRLAAMARVLAEALGDALSRARASRARAYSLRASGAYAESLADYERSAQLFAEAGDFREVARTRLGQNQALMFLGRNEEALVLAEEARGVFRALRDRRNLATANLNLGVVYSYLDRHHEAVRFYDRAYRGYRGVGDSVMAATVDVNRGLSLTLLGRFKAALQAYNRARPVIAAEGLAALVAMTDANLAYLHFVQGHYATALDRLLAARATFAEINVAADLATVDLDLSEVYLAVNQVDEAAALSVEAMATFDALEMPYESARARVNRALALLVLDRVDEALDLLDEASQLFESQGNQVGAATAAVCYAQALQHMGRLEEAFEVANRAKTVFQSNNTPVRLGYACITSGVVAAAQKETALAQTEFEQALRLGRQLSHAWLLYQAHSGLGRLVEAHDRSLARTHYLEAVSHLERVRTELRGEDLRLAFLQDKLKVYEDLIELSLEDGSDQSVREVFDLVERARGRALLDLMTGALDVRIRATDPKDVQALEHLRALTEELNGLYTLLARDEGKLRKTPDLDDQALRLEAEHRERQIERLLRQLQVRRAPSSVHDIPLIRLEDVQASLQEDETLLAYYTIEDEILAFVVTSDSVTLKRGLTSAAQVMDVADRLWAQMNRFAYGPEYVEAHRTQLADLCSHHMEELYSQMIRPLAPFMRGRRIIVIPHGVLHYLPFHAFENEGRALIDDYEITYAPSASILRLCSTLHSRCSGHPLLIGVAAHGLPNVRREIAAIAALLPSAEILLDETATREGLRQACQNSNLIHLACHSVFRPESPLFSSLWLDDGWLSVHDVYNLELNADLVTLSACNTGISHVAPGDELLGLVRAFFYAGAASLVVSLWPVDDFSTAAFMEKFYASLQTGVSKASALRSAMLGMRAADAHPYYWAPFILLGAP